MAQSERITVLDILRLFGGILLANSFFSWWFTGSSTWGYDGKWINPRFYKFQLVGPQVNFTTVELSQFDGHDPNLPIYIALNGSVYDVTASRQIYGPKGTYGFFSGKDAARAFVTGCFFKDDEFTHDLRGLDPAEADHDIRGWKKFFESNPKYWYVGTVHHEPLLGEPPEPCEHRKFPHRT